jgi:hypothetical protein
MDLLRWWRFLRAVDVCWDRASRAEARDFKLLDPADGEATACGGPLKRHRLVEWCCGIAESRDQQTRNLGRAVRRGRPQPAARRRRSGRRETSPKPAVAPCDANSSPPRPAWPDHNENPCCTCPTTALDPALATTLTGRHGHLTNRASYPYHRDRQWNAGQTSGYTTPETKRWARRRRTHHTPTRVGGFRLR